MTLDEAIKHAEEVAEDKKAQAWEAQLQEEYGKVKSCKECAEEHRQLAEWLKELKAYKEQSGDEELDFVQEHKKIPCTMTIGKPCEDAIRRQAVLNILDDTVKNYIKENDFDKAQGVAWVKVQKLPPVTPQPRKGHWIRIGDRDFGYRDIVICKCSECGDEKEFTGKFELEGHRLVIDMDHVYKFCPDCGAKMERSDKE